MRAVWIKLNVNTYCCRFYEDVGGVKLFEIVYRIKLVNKVWKIGLQSYVWNVMED